MKARGSVLSLLIGVTFGSTTFGTADAFSVRQPSPQSGWYVVLFEQPNYRGNPRNFSGATSSVSSDRSVRPVGSVTIGRGVWDLCEGDNYSGRCITLDRSVPDLSAYNLRTVRSVRPSLRAESDWYVVLFDRINYRGHPVNFKRAVPRTASNQHVQSVTIGKGVWEICDGANYTGHCTTLNTSVPDLRAYGFRGRVSSLRPVAPQPR